MASVCQETETTYTRLWEDGQLLTCEAQKRHLPSFKLKTFRQKFSKRPKVKEVEVLEIVGQSGRRHAICREIEKRVFVDSGSAKVPRVTLDSTHKHMIHRHRLIACDLI